MRSMIPRWRQQAKRQSQGARPYRDNAFKVTLAERAVLRAVREAGQ